VTWRYKKSSANNACCVYLGFSYTHLSTYYCVKEACLPIITPLNGTDVSKAIVLRHTLATYTVRVFARLWRLSFSGLKTLNLPYPPKHRRTILFYLSIWSLYTTTYTIILHTTKGYVKFLRLFVKSKLHVKARLNSFEFILQVIPFVHIIRFSYVKGFEIRRDIYEFAERSKPELGCNVVYTRSCIHET